MQQEILIAIISGIAAIVVALVGARVWRRGKPRAEEDEHVPAVLRVDPDALPAGSRTTGYWEAVFRRILREELQPVIQEIRAVLDRIRGPRD